jgi:hypothetical protein
MSKKKTLITIVIFLFALAIVHFQEVKKVYELTIAIVKEELKPPEKSPFLANANPMEAVITSPEEFEDDSISAVEDRAPAKIEESKPSKVEGPKAYLNSISAASRMMIKFLRHEDYRPDLSVIDKSRLPLEVKLIVQDMEEFANTYNPGAKTAPLRLFPDRGVLDRLVGHFVQIEKLPHNSTDKNIKYEQISSRLYILQNYFYSQDFLNDTWGSHD